MTRKQILALNNNNKKTKRILPKRLTFALLKELICQEKWKSFMEDEL